MVLQLEKFEKDEPAMTYYFPDLINGHRRAAEGKSVCRKSPFITADMHRPHRGTALVEGSGIGSRKIDWTRATARSPCRMLRRRRSFSRRVLKQDPNQPRALYGLAIASVLDGKAVVAKELFEKVVVSATPGSERRVRATPDLPMQCNGLVPHLSRPYP